MPRPNLMRGTRRRLRINIVPPLPRTGRERAVWWIDLISMIVTLTAPYAAFRIAGGSRAQTHAWINRFADAKIAGTHLPVPPRPLLAAVFVLLLLVAYGTLIEYGSRKVMNRHFNRWYAAQHPDQVPDDLVAVYAQEALRRLGPLTAPELLHHLADGGSWGPGVTVSPAGLTRKILNPGGRPAAWLAPRQFGDPYSLLVSPYQPGAADEFGAVVERAVLLHGPLHLSRLVDLVRTGGEHGQPVNASTEAIAKQLRAATWLAPREKGGVFAHVHAGDLEKVAAEGTDRQ